MPLTVATLRLGALVRHLRIFLSTAIGATALLSSSAIGFAAESSNTYPVGAGDVLQVIIFGEANTSDVLSGRFRVEPDGSIDYPLLGNLVVSGKSTREVGKLIGASLSEQIPVSPPAVSVAEFAPVSESGRKT